jgi:hypothetical protein
MESPSKSPQKDVRDQDLKLSLELTPQAIIIECNDKRIEIEKAKYSETPALLLHSSLEAAGLEVTESEFKRILAAINHALEEEKNGKKLGHLNLVEDPSNIGAKVVAEATIASTSVAFIAPKKIIARYLEDGNKKEEIVELSTGDKRLINFIKVPEGARYKAILNLFPNIKAKLENSKKGEKEISDLYFEEKEYYTIYQLKVRPPVFSLKKVGEKIIDEKGYEYKAFDAYVVGEKQISFEAGAIVRLYAIPIREPKTQQLVLLVWKIEKPEDIYEYDIEKLRTLKAKLDALGTTDKKVNWILDNFERFSKIKKRRNVAFANLETAFSPLFIKLDKLERGWLNTGVMGDTTTGKSETALKMIQLLNGGIFITAETASQVGLIGTAEQIGKEGWLLEWGFLTLADRKLLVIDGAQKLPISLYAGIAEAERQGTITIAKAARGTAYARTRQIKIANPVNREEGKLRETKSMREFLYPAIALTTVFDKVSIARMDIAIFVSADDVTPNDVNTKNDEEPEAEFLLLSEALKFCWSNNVEVKIEDEAYEAILNEATKLYNEFHSDRVPLVTIDTKYKLTRLATALAFLTLSTNGDFSEIYVKKDHVEYIANFLREEYRRAGLHVLAQEESHAIITEEEANEEIESLATASSLEKDKVEEILRYIATHGRATRDELKQIFSLSENNETRPLLATMVSHGLIESKRGLYPTSKLILLIKALENKRLTRLTTLTTSEKNPPIISEESGSEKIDEEKNNGGSLCDHVKHVNLVKNSNNILKDKTNEAATSPEPTPQPLEEDEQKLLHGLCQPHYRQLPTSELANYEFHAEVGFCEKCGHKVLGIFVKKGGEQQ